LKNLLRGNILKGLFVITVILGIAAALVSFATAQFALGAVSLLITLFAPILFMVERRIRINNQYFREILADLHQRPVSGASLVNPVEENKPKVVTVPLAEMSARRQEISRLDEKIDSLSNQVNSMRTMLLLDTVYNQQRNDITNAAQ